MEKKELNLDEMEQAAGGKGGSKKELPRKDGVIVYQIERGFAEEDCALVQHHG